MFFKNKQRGYLLEVPLLLMVVGILLAVFLPILPKIPAKILVILGALVWIAGSYYMLIIPGWQPESYTKSRLRFPWNWLVFIVQSVILLVCSGLYFIQTN